MKLSLESQLVFLKVKVVQSYVTLCNPMDYTVHNSPGQNNGMGTLSLLQGLFPTQGSNPSLLRFGQILYQLSHTGRPRILEWVAYPFSSGFPTQELNQDLLHCKRILYQLSYQGSLGLLVCLYNLDSYVCV